MDGALKRLQEHAYDRFEDLTVKEFAEREDGPIEEGGEARSSSTPSSPPAPSTE